MNEWCEDKSLEQGSTEWKSARSKRLGGSEIASVLRISPYKNRYQLWEEKTGRVAAKDISKMPHVQRGIKAEAIARSMLERRHQVKYSSPVVVHPHHQWAVASLDGLCSSHTLEIKTMGLEKHLDVRDGFVPDYYKVQVLWGLMITNQKRGLFASYRPEDNSLYEVWIDRDKAWEEEVFPLAEQFMEWVFKDIEPPEDFVLSI
jgi:putative phage-type endonuclease